MKSTARATGSPKNIKQLLTGSGRETKSWQEREPREEEEGRSEEIGVLLALATKS